MQRHKISANRHDLCYSGSVIVPRPHPSPIILYGNRFLFVDYLNDSTDDSADDTGVGWVILFALPCILGAVFFLVGAVCAFKAVRKWEQSGITLPI